MKSATLLSLLAVTLTFALSEGVMVCYFSSTQSNIGHYSSFVDDIDPFLCTHIIYAFAGVGEDLKVSVDNPEIDLCGNGSLCGYDRFTDLKKINTELVTTLSLGGGGNAAVEQFSELAADSIKRKTFVDSVVDLLVEHNFDGVDVDWEFPTCTGNMEDKGNFVLLMNDFREALDVHGMILTIAVPGGKYAVDAGYDVPKVAETVDLIHIMGYDLHGSEPYTHHHTILYPYPLDEGVTLERNLDFFVHYWMEMGAPADKLVLGMATYAHCWALNSTDNVGMYAPGVMYNTLKYSQMCEYRMNNPGDIVIIHEDCMNEPYGVDLGTKIWCGYDDPDSLALKTQYAIDNGLAGAMVWTLNYDDFRGTCHGSPSPLLNSIKNTLAAANNYDTMILKGHYNVLI